jgi:hypothetical protein
MPITPFHLGPALLGKSLAGRWFSLTAFAASQVVIDLESLYWLARDQWPVHRVLHTFVGGALVGVLVAPVVCWLLPRVARPAGRLLPTVAAWLRGSAPPEALAAESRAGPALAGGLLGGLSHSLLDGIMHLDIQPLRPFGASNPFQGALDLPALHLACTLAGLLGLVVWIIRGRRGGPRRTGR